VLRPSCPDRYTTITPRSEPMGTEFTGFMPYDAVVVGAGPAGSLMAERLARSGHRVALVERSESPAPEACCTGLVSHSYLRLARLEDTMVVGAKKSAVFVSPSGHRLHVQSSTPQAYVLDRNHLDEHLRRRAVAAGAEYIPGTTVEHIEGVIHKRRRVKGRSRAGPMALDARCVVLSHGSAPGLMSSVGLEPPRRYMVGAHAVLEMDGVAETEIHLLQDVARGLVGWLMPIDEVFVRAGVLSRRSGARFLRSFIASSVVRSRLRAVQSGCLVKPVPVALSCRMTGTRIVAIGDAAGQVKPTTGGGLYLGAAAVDVAADVLDRCLREDDLSAPAIREYERTWRKLFGSEVRREALLRKVYEAIGPRGVDRMIARASSAGIADGLLASSGFSFDHHSSTLAKGMVKSLAGTVASFAPGGTRR